VSATGRPGYGRAQGWIGAPLRRREDARLLAGAGRFVDDLDLPGTLHLVVVRSPHAHARLRDVDLAAARRRPGVVAAIDGAAVWRALGPLPHGARKRGEAARLRALDPTLVPVLRLETQPLVAVEVVRYVGEPVALVLATDRYPAEDAAEQVAVAYEPLPALVDLEAAARPDAPRVHADLPDNLSLRLHLRHGDAAAAFAAADRVVARRFRLPRTTGVPIETRGVLARPEPGGGLTVWAASQSVHLLRDAIAEQLRLDPARVRVVAPDVGGGFGVKSGVQSEAILAAWLALAHGRPVKWIEDRAEHLRSAPQARDQLHEIALALRADGTLLGLRDRFLVDTGAYNPLGLGQPFNTASHLVGPYRVPAVDIEGAVYFTHKAPYAPVRGAGRPEAVFALERALDLAARQLGLDPVELRRRNLITPAEMPYATGLRARDGQPQQYDSGDYPALLERALDLVAYARLRAEQPALWARGVYRGVGVAAYVETTGSGPFESAAVGLDAAGHIWVYTGACAQGQGHETVFAQICAERLGVPVEQVTVVGGDTGAIARGQGTRASRSTVAAGSAIAEAARAVAAQLRARAAAWLEASPADLELRDGLVRVRGVPDRAAPFAQLVAAAATGALVAAPGRPPLVLHAACDYEPPTFAYASAVHAAVVEVDIATGAVKLLRYAVAHDAGRLVNPLLADGQVCGGVAYGIGNALFEELRYDASGQLLTASLSDYLLPTSADLPSIALAHLESPTPRNPLGVKGLGEGGAIGPPAALANAVEDALRPFGVEVHAVPLTPERVLALLTRGPARDERRARAVP